MPEQGPNLAVKDSITSGLGQTYMTIDKSKIEQNLNDVTTETFTDIKVLQGKLHFNDSSLD